MKTINFATTNSRKVAEAKAGCERYKIKVNQISLEIDEIQSSDFVAVAENKATQVYQKTNAPVVVTDTAWQIPALNGFPGVYMKEVADWFTSEDFIRLLSKTDDRRVCFIESIAYKDENESKVFSRKFWGEIVQKPKGRGNSIEQVASFDGGTIAEKRDDGKLSHDPRDYIWTDFAKWYAAKP